MELFDFIKILFTDPQQFLSISKGEKRKQYFMTQRRLAINFPMQANALQHQKINQSVVIDFWHRFLRKQFKSIPNWMYIKGIKKSQEIKEKKINVNADVIKGYCKTFKIDEKSIMDALHFFPDKMIKELKDYENMIKQK